jgi:hypothetical protein
MWLPVLASGCVPAAVLTGSYLEAKREVSRDFAAPLDRVWPATLAARRDSRAEVRDSVRDNLGGDIDGTWPGAGPLVVRMEQTAGGVTQVRMRIGEYGNSEATESLFGRISATLQEQP